MKSAKRILSIVMLVVLILSFVGCAASSAVLPVKLNNGDSFNIKLQSDSKSLELKFDKDKDNLFKLCEDGVDVLVGGFQTQESMESYVYRVYLEVKNGNVEVIDGGEINGVKYSIIAINKADAETVYEIIGWIVGSNTGIIIDGTTSEIETIKLFETLTFEIKKTEQPLTKYHFENIDNFEAIKY